jgi:hypothetical protein
MLKLCPWPPGSRVIVRRERPHPGAGLELRHRRHARVEDRIRQSKAAGLDNFPCRGLAENKAWTEVALAAADLVCWAKLLCFADEPRRCSL